LKSRHKARTKCIGNNSDADDRGHINATATGNAIEIGRLAHAE